MYKRNSKILVALLTIVLVFSIFPSLRVNADESGTCGDNITWTLSNHTLSITGTGDMTNFNSGKAPWYKDRDYISSVYIDDGVTSIGSSAFERCEYIESVRIPESVTSIGASAFDGCLSFRSITIPDSVTSIGRDAFYHCYSLSSITIPDSVTSIGTYAFGYCNNLNTVTMNSSLAEKCRDNVVFDDCPSSLKINYSDINITYNDDGNGTVTGYVPGSDPTTVYLTLTPDTGYVVNTVTVTDSTGTPEIVSDTNGNYTFALPSGDATVDATFIKGGYCGDPSVNGGKDVTWIYDDSTKTLTISGTGDMTDYNGNMYQPWHDYSDDIETIVISDGITSTGDYAFSCCENVTSISISNSVKSIGRGSFSMIYTLSNIDIPDSVTSICDSVFVFCTGLTSITIPDSVTSIDGGVFSECTSLTDVTMSKDLYDDLVQNNKLDIVFSGITLPSIHFSYTVDCKSNGNGTISGTTTKSFGTDQIELTIQPDSNYELDKIAWSDGTNSGVLTESNGKYTMPDSEAGQVTISATFKLIQKTVKFVNADGTVLLSVDVDYGTNPAYTGTTPVKAGDDKYTYTFAGWSDGTKTYGPTDTLPAVTDDVTYTATFTKTAKSTEPEEPTKPAPVTKPGTYYLSSMEEQDGKLVITIKMNEDDSKTFDLLGSISSDGVLLTEGNQYARAKGSLIITLQKSYLDTLAAGNHKLTVTFTDGGSITIDYVVKAPATASVPATGEAISTASILGCIILATAGITFAVARKRKEEV